MLARTLIAAVALAFAMIGVSVAQTPPTDPQIAHIAYTAGQLDIAAAEQAIKKSKNQDIIDFAGDEGAIRTLVRRHNQRLFRVVRAIVHNDAEAEDVVQASYVNAFTHLSTFRGDAELATWLTRITINEATARLRQRRPSNGLEQVEAEQGRSAQIIQFPLMNAQLDPETEMARQEVRHFLEQKSLVCIRPV